MKRLVQPATTRLGLAILLSLFATAASARLAEVYAGTWGAAGLRQGRVFRYEFGTTWTEISPPGGLADAVWDLEFVDGELWAGTHDGSHSIRDTAVPHGTSGRVFRWDGAAWHDMSPAGGFASAVTTVNEVDGAAHVTVDSRGLYRHGGGTSWTLLDSFTLSGQSIVSSTHAGTPMLYIGQDNTDEFWVYDPLGALACGVPTAFGCQVPPLGVVCGADCFPGSCIHAMAEFDDQGAAGNLVYAGAFGGLMYRWNPPTRLFQRIDRIPEVRTLDYTHDNIHGLAEYHGLLWAGFSNGRLWSSPDATGPTWSVAHDFGDPSPVSEMLVVPEDDLLWMGFGGVPYRWSRNDGTSAVRTFDGVSHVVRSLPGQFLTGVLCLVARVPPVECVAAVAQAVECDAVPAVANPFPIPACLTPGVATFEGEERFDGACPDSYRLERRWSVTNPCGVDRVHLECIDVVDTTAPALVDVPADTTVSCAQGVPPPAGVSAMDNCDPAPGLTFDELRVNGACPDAYELHRTWTATDRCGHVTVDGHVVTVVDRTPPLPFALFRAAAPLPPSSAASPVSARRPVSAASAVSACSAPASATVRIECGAVDDCDPAPAVTATLVVTRHVVTAARTCVPVIDRVPLTCGDEVVIELLAAPCPASGPRSTRAAVSVNSTGQTFIAGESVVLEVTSTDRCGNTATLTSDPTRQPAAECATPRPDGTCCPVLAKPAAEHCRGPACGT